MNVKYGVDLRFLRPEVSSKLFNIERIFKFHAGEDFPVVITSGSDGKHSSKSKHYKHLAIDIRVWKEDDSPDPDEEAFSFLEIRILNSIREDLETFLGDDWDVILEFRAGRIPSHLHLEYDP